MADQDAQRWEQAIRRYLEAHPQAADTVEGIAAWWLEGVEPRPTAGELQPVLDAMANAHQIARIRLVDGNQLFGASRQRAPP